MATDVEVEMASPLTGPKKRGAHSAKPADKSDPLALGDKKTDTEKKPVAGKKTGDKTVTDKTAADKSTDKSPDAADKKDAAADDTKPVKKPLDKDAKKPADDSK